MLRKRPLLFWLSIAPIAMFLTACDPASFKATCPALNKYSTTFLQQAADEFDRLPKGSALRVLIMDYGKQRDACRALQR